MTRRKGACARSQALSERGDVHLLEVRRKRVELRKALRQEARSRIRGPHHQELVECSGDLNEPLEKLPLRPVRGDSPALLPRLVSLEELSGIEEALAARKGGIHRSLPALEPYADLARRVRMASSALTASARTTFPNKVERRSMRPIKIR